MPSPVSSLRNLDVETTLRNSVVFSSIYTEFTACELIFFHPKGAAGPSLVGVCMTEIAEMFLMSKFLSPLERD